MNISKTTLVAALVSVLAAAPALADKDGKGKGKGRGHDHDRVVRVDGDHGRHDDDRHGRHHDADRVVIVERHHDRSCPPGLAKKNNGCLPPGQAKKANRVVVGQALPPGAVFVVPQRVRATLPPPPFGYRYAVVNNQVVLVSDTNIVVDIIRSLLG